ncbi:hypothetical protein FJZ48_03545 [Candidatus Uhrbacteria bacterium]|nr:hypothetical protein [Candidatus Uhrbacteria bacterium]
MDPSKCSRPSEEIEAALNSLDLSRIRFKLVHPGEGYDWSEEKAVRVERYYKRFLFLTVTSDEPIVPTEEIDTFWHAHILDTRKYHTDCQQVFGFYLHHFPYFGLRGEQDAANLAYAFARTKCLYQERYGEPYAEMTAIGSDCSDVSCQACGWKDISSTATLQA